MTQETIDDRTLKAKHAKMWAQGNYTAVATEVIAALGPTLVEAAGVRAEHTVLDIAAGAGNVAVPAALTGADVVASDLTPELLARGEQLATEQGAKLRWEQGDAEHLPYDDASFDVVLSCVGVMFAPNQQATADELVRVARPGGTIGLINWTPQGFIGQMFATMKPYAPPPPPGAKPAPLWGDEDHVRTLLGDRVTSIETRRQNLRVDAFGTPEEFREYFKTNYGPTISVYKFNEADPDKIAGLDHDLAELGRRFTRPDGTMDWEYLLVIARRG
jgi:ubiquinone/menaquinone biosynthesis C-methylase UbiE